MKHNTENDNSMIGNSHLNKKLNNKGPVVLQILPIIDKLSCVIDIDDKKLVSQCIHEIINYFEENSPDVIKTKVKGNYGISARIPYPDDDGVIDPAGKHVLFQVKNPKTAAKSQIRIEYNPFYISDIAEAHLDVIILGLIGVTFYELIGYSKVTRVDVYKTIMGHSPMDFLFHGKWKKNAQAHWSCKNGLETLYLGNSTGNQFVIYNKSIQDGSQEAIGDTIRIECRIKVNLPIKQLASMPCPFDRLSIVSMACKKPPLGTAHWRAFQDSCRMRGIPLAVKHQPADVRSKINAALKSNKVAWWPGKDCGWAKDWQLSLAKAGLNKIPAYLPKLICSELIGKVG